MSDGSILRDDEVMSFMYDAGLKFSSDKLSSVKGYSKVGIANRKHSL